MEKNDYKIALLIDSENVSAKYVEAVLNETSKYGTLVISRFYGDITKTSDEWKKVALKYALKPMHQYNVASGKNAADMAMALDAQEIMYNGKVNAFFIVTSDSDFTPLASKLRESGMIVIGVGSEEIATSAFKSSCNEFKYFEYLMEDDNKTSTAVSIEKKEDIDIDEVIKNIIVESGTDNKIQLSYLGIILLNRFSDFDSRKYGAKTLLNLVKTIKGISVTFEKSSQFVELKSICNYDDVSKECLKILQNKSNHQMKLTKLKQELEKKFENFDYRTLGFTTFSKLIKNIDGLSVVDEVVSLL